MNQACNDVAWACQYSPNALPSRMRPIIIARTTVHARLPDKGAPGGRCERIRQRSSMEPVGLKTWPFRAFRVMGVMGVGFKNL